MRSHGHEDTGIGGRSGQFPATHHSAIVSLRSADANERERGMTAVITAYWKPVYKYLRIRWRKDNDAAKDLTQSFFLSLMERDTIAGYDPAVARFRTFLRACLDKFASQIERDAGRLKRGGGMTPLSLDYETAESELAGALPVVAPEPERLFEDEWVRDLLARAITELRSHCETHDKMIALRAFELYDLSQVDDAERPTYKALAEQLGVSSETVTNHLAYARREFRRIVLDQIRAITATDREFRDEVRAVLGINPT